MATRNLDPAVAGIFQLEGDIPRSQLPDASLPADVAYQIVHDELALDGNSRQNPATFVTTWMEPQAERLMTECFDKNMIGKDEYPQAAEVESTSSATWGTRPPPSMRRGARRPARARRRCSAGWR